MSPKDYWYGDVWLARGYYEAEKLRKERANTEAWQQGYYVHQAVASVISHVMAKSSAEAFDYPEKPYSLKADEEKEDKDALKAMLYMQNMVLAGKSWGKEQKNGN